MERLLSSPLPGFRGFFGPDWEARALTPRTDREGKQAERIQQGILDFVRLYQESGMSRYVPSISGRDAAAPAYLWMEARRGQTAGEDIQCVLA